MTCLRKLAYVSAALAVLASPIGWADAQQECEKWAQDDNVSPMLWDQYVESCVQRMRSEENDEPPRENDAEPLGTPPTPKPPGIDLNY